MSLVERRSVHLLVRIGAIMLNTLTLLTPAAAVNSIKHPFLVSAARGEPVDCSVKGLNFDAVAVPTGDQSRVVAAAIAYSQGRAPRIFFVGADSTFESAQEKYLKGIPKNNIVYGNNSYNTATDTEELKKLVDQYNINNVYLVTGRGHIVRASALSCLRGIPTSPLSTEQLLNYLPQGDYETNLKERAEVLLLFLDTDAYIPKVMYKLRYFTGRVLDGLLYQPRG